MVSLQDTKRISERRTVECSDLHTSLSQVGPIPPRRRPAPQPIIEDVDRDPLLCLSRQGIEETTPGLVITDNVVLEVDEGFGTLDRGQPGLKRGGSLELQSDPIPSNRCRVRCPRKGDEGDVPRRARYLRDFQGPWVSPRIGA